MRFLLVSYSILLPTLAASAQSTYDLTGKPDASIKEPFTQVAGVRELPGNRAIVTDQSERLVFLVDFSEGSRRQIGRQGDGPAEYRFPNTQTCTRLANGNTIICSRGGNGKGPQLVEVTRDKKVVWVLQDWANLGPATAVQILDDPGIPETPGESEH